MNSKKDAKCCIPNLLSPWQECKCTIILEFHWWGVESCTDPKLIHPSKGEALRPPLAIIACFQRNPTKAIEAISTPLPLCFHFLFQTSRLGIRPDSRNNSEKNLDHYIIGQYTGC
jgi:hypothetical protein